MNIYKLLPVCLFIFFFSNNSIAQFQMSVWGGANSSSFGGSPPKDASYGSLTGLSFGVALDFKTSREFEISIEPTYEQTGSTIDYNMEEGLEDTTISFNVRQNYFGLGLLFKVNAGNFLVGSGVSFQLLSSATLESDTLEEDIKDQFINYDAVAFFTLGYKIPIGGPSIFFELRYLQGLVDLLNEENESETLNYLENFKSTGLKLATGIIIPL